MCSKPTRSSKSQWEARRAGRESGQALILVIVATSILLIGVIGFAIDGAQMYAQRQLAQTAADAAAQAGILSIMSGTNSTSTYTFATGTPPLASSSCTTTDGRTPCVYARDNGFGGTTADTVTLSYPSSVTGITLSSVTVPAFQVTVQRTLPTGFIRFIGGPSSTTITARAIAGITGTASPYCVYALDASGSYALTAQGTLAASGSLPGSVVGSGSGTISITGCAVIVDSSAGSALLLSGSATTLAASGIALVGSVAVGSGVSTPAPVTGVSVVADPFASLPAPTPGSCLYSTKYTPVNGATLVPGTYCGGINIAGPISVTFSPGIYIINGGGITFAAGTTSTGSGVMFYLTGTNASYGSVTVNGSANVTLSAPTSGSYRGILFYQDRSITSPANANFATTGTLALSGSLYFPTTDVFFQSGSGTTPYPTAIVANDITFTNDTYITGTGANNGLSAASVALVQ